MAMVIDARGSEPKLTIRIVEGQGRKWLALCDASGTPLPKQKALVLNESVDDIPTVTVTFIVDGRKVALHAGD